MSKLGCLKAAERVNWMEKEFKEQIRRQIINYNMDSQEISDAGVAVACVSGECGTLDLVAVIDADGDSVAPDSAVAQALRLERRKNVLLEEQNRLLQE